MVNVLSKANYSEFIIHIIPFIDKNPLITLFML